MSQPDPFGLSLSKAAPFLPGEEGEEGVPFGHGPKFILSDAGRRRRKDKLRANGFFR
jgi:hypothetical protein